ncbi:MAG: catD [Bacteroidota bacterium]|nr:catD [Bacteroidota bacterium]
MITSIRATAITILLFAAGISYSQISIDVSTLGAIGDSSAINTSIIQKAIDSVFNAGGGEVIINNGVYISSTIVLRSNVTLRVTSGTTLRAMPNDADYPSLPYNVRSWSDTYTTHSLVFAEDENNIRITGGGTVDGNGFGIGYLSISKNYRPFGLRIHDCNNVIIDSINLRQAPQWMGHIVGCTNVHINAISIYNTTWGSNDGIDIDCCRNVLVENSRFDTNDDCLPIKTHSEGICRDVLVCNCTMASYERAIKVGNETLGPLVNIRF